jgi:hypothetical protein
MITLIRKKKSSSSLKSYESVVQTEKIRLEAIVCTADFCDLIDYHD